jgi:hypothetical protein
VGAKLWEWPCIEDPHAGTGAAHDSGPARRRHAERPNLAAAHNTVLFSHLCPVPSDCSTISTTHASPPTVWPRLCLDAFKLNRIGAFAEGAVTRLKWGDHGGCLLARRAPNILINGNPVLVVWDEQGRPWFECRCGRRVKHIYLDAIACRTCCVFEHASRHLHRSVPGVHRVMRWRRMIGIDRHPFAAIPKRPRHHTRFHRIVARIRAEESKLVGHLGGITRDLERRARLRGMLPK